MSEVIEKVGWEEFEDMIDFVIASAKAVNKAQEDGQITWTDLVYLVEPLMKVPDMVTGFTEIDDELLDLDDEEVQQIIDYVNSNYDFEREKAEKIAKAAIKAALYNMRLYLELKA